jgi:predicted TPR repeat methyltransferase
MGEGRRYVHGACYVRTSLDAAGLVVLQLEQQPVRCEAGAPVPGLVIVAQKS